jgi:phage N-6-adenine-methyltransferase
MVMPEQKPGRSKQDYGTPWEFVAACERRFGELAVDLAADERNAKAMRYIDEARNSLAVPWAAEFPTGNLWLNPPFADLGSWASKCALESKHRHGLILMLTPASVGAAWFAQHVHGRAMVFALSPRLTFEGTEDPYPKDLMLSAFGMGMAGFDVWRGK